MGRLTPRQTAALVLVGAPGLLDGDLYAKLGVWLLAFAAAGGTAHLVLTRFGRSAEPRAV